MVFSSIERLATLRPFTRVSAGLVLVLEEDQQHISTASKCAQRAASSHGDRFRQFQLMSAGHKLSKDDFITAGYAADAYRRSLWELAQPFELILRIHMPSITPHLT